MNPKRRALMVSGASAAVAGCSSPGLEQFGNQQPVLDLRRYFDGVVDAWGFVRNRDGTISQRFTVVIRCAWTGDTGTLDETFTYSDGRTQKRVWTLRKAGNLYTGTAADVVGEARGEASGNAFRLRYVLDFPRGESTVHLDVDDWMYLMDDSVMLNRSSISKLGIEVAQVFLSFRRRS